MKKLTRRDFLRDARNLGISIGLLPLIKEVSMETPQPTPDSPVYDPGLFNVATECLLHGSSASASAISYYGITDDRYLPGHLREASSEKQWVCNHCGSTFSKRRNKCPNCGGWSVVVQDVS